MDIYWSIFPPWLRSDKHKPTETEPKTYLKNGYLLAELTSEFKELLAGIKPNFEENLRRAFINEAVRNQARKNSKTRFVHQLDDNFLSVGDTKIELRNLKFPWIPDFRVSEMSVNFPMLCLDVSFKLGNLRVEGEYEANNLTLQRLLPVSNNGKIVISFSEVTAKGKVGLLMKEDSFVPENYDIAYISTGTEVSVSYFVDDENEIENKITKSDGEMSLGDTIWQQLQETLTQLLHNQLGEVVVEYSVQELLCDEQEQLREVAREHATRANKLLDSLLCTSKDYIVSQNFRTVKTPPFNVIYRGKPSGVHQGSLQTGEGYLQELSTLTRLQDLSLYEDKNELVVYGSINLREFKHGYESFTSEFEDTKISGSIKSSVYRNKIFIKLSVAKEGEQCYTRLDTVQIRMVKDIDVDASGLASLSWLGPKLKSWVIGNLRYNALPVLEKYITEAFNHAIENMDCVALIAE